MSGLMVLTACAISFVIGIILIPVFIPVLKKLKFGQQIREEGPEAHLKKSGTPTMGGIVIVIAALAGMAAFTTKDSLIWPVMAVTFLFGLIGFLDDFLKIKKHQSEGLKAWQKMGLQIIVTVLLCIYTAEFSGLGTEILLPFYKSVDFGAWYYPLVIIAVLGTVNGANFTDGLDGLAGSVTLVILGFFTLSAVLLGSGLAAAPLAMAGAVAAFLCFNCYPAKIFMGDTGSLALGGFVCAMALFLKMPIFLILIAFIYLAEIVSVILQVGYFKLSHGKRLFKMAPIHHHFEILGWSEVRVVTVFSIVTLIMGIIAYIALVPAIG